MSHRNRGTNGPSGPCIIISTSTSFSCPMVMSPQTVGGAGLLCQKLLTHEHTLVTSTWWSFSLWSSRDMGFQNLCTYRGQTILEHHSPLCSGKHLEKVGQTAETALFIWLIYCDWGGGGNQLCGRKYPSQTETRPHYQTFQSNCLTLGVWNVRTLCSLNSLTNKNLPTWKAYCACLQRTCPFSTDVAALSKTSFPGECDVKKADYKFFWKGKDANELCIYGISLAIKTELVKKLILTPTSTSWCPSEFRFASRSTYFSLCFNSRLRWRN